MRLFNDIQEEEDKYNNIKKNLKQIIKEGEDRYYLFIGTNVSDLPVYNGLIPQGIVKWVSPCKSTKETNEEYLKRVFDSFEFLRSQDNNDFDEKGGWMIAKKRNLELYFEVERSKPKTKKEKVKLFEPFYSDHESIVEVIPVRYHDTEIRYQAYSENSSDNRASKNVVKFELKGEKAFI